MVFQGDGNSSEPEHLSFYSHFNCSFIQFPPSDISYNLYHRETLWSKTRKSEMRSNIEGIEGVFIVYLFDLAKKVFGIMVKSKYPVFFDGLIE